MLFALSPALAGANEAQEENRQQILAVLADEIPPARLQLATVFVGGDLAALRLPTRAGESVIYVFERPADDAVGWTAVARITAPGEEHFGDAILLSPNAILVAAPDLADAGLGPGATYVFQRHVGGPDQWGLVAKLALGDYPPPGAIRVQPLVEPAVAPPPESPTSTAVATPPPVVMPPPPTTEPAPSPARVTEPLPPAAAMPKAEVPEAEVSATEVPETEVPAAEAEVPPTPAAAPAETPPTPAAEVPAEVPSAEAAPMPAEPQAEVPPTPAAELAQAVPAAVPPTAPAEVPPTAPPTAVAEADERSTPTTETEKPQVADEPPTSEDQLRYIAVANMSERPRALALAASLRDKGYPSEIHRNERGFFVVTLARLPRAEARKQRNQAVAAGDISKEAYLIVGTSFREKISP